MNDSSKPPILTPPNQAPPNRSISRHFTTQSLAQALHRGDLSVADVRALPAQTLFMAMKHSGIPASGELVLQASVEQVRLFMDLDCWHKDTFREDAFWEWLSLADEEDGLEALQKVLKSIDLRLVGLLIARHVHTITFDEGADAPPQAGYYTPDGGHTWIGIKIEDATRHFLLARFLALLFETNADLFYQILATPGVATESTLEEDAYADRIKRLAAEGVPEPELAASVHAPLSDADIPKLFHEKHPKHLGESLSAVQPLIYDSRLPRPLANLFEDASQHEALESELSFIMNAAIVFFSVDPHDQERVRFLSEQVKGALNIGLERALHGTKELSAADLYKQIGLGALYRLGHTHLSFLRRQALRGTTSADQEQTAIFEALKAWPPYTPSFVFESRESGVTELNVAPRPILSYQELLTLKDLITGKADAILQ